MKIKIEEIPPEGLRKEVEYDPKELDMEYEGLHFSTPIGARAEITLVGREVVIRVRVQYKLRLVCSRCLDEYEVAFEKEYIFNYNTQGLTIIDITDDIRDEIMLNYPVKPLCREDCKGICPGCGANLNREECRCNRGEGG